MQHNSQVWAGHQRYCKSEANDGYISVESHKLRWHITKYWQSRYSWLIDLQFMSFVKKGYKGENSYDVNKRRSKLVHELDFKTVETVQMLLYFEMLLKMNSDVQSCQENWIFCKNKDLFTRISFGNCRKQDYGLQRPNKILTSQARIYKCRLEEEKKKQTKCREWSI